MPLRKDVEDPALLYLVGEALQELLPDGRAVVLLELLPLLRLRRQDEVHDVARHQAEGAVVSSAVRLR